MTDNMNLSPEEAFALVWNDKRRFPAIADVAQELDLAVQTCKNKAVLMRKRRAFDDTVPELIDRTRGEAPMSEDAARFRPDWTADDCVAELLRVASIDPDRVVTRNYFRVNSDISESTWNRYFGTFEEFKRQASIKLSRQQHGLERAIAKHASVDHYRRVGEERKNWGDRYERDPSGRWKTILVCSDLHDHEVDAFYLRVLIETARRAQPDIIVLNGDVFDLPEFGKYTVDPREWDVVGRIRFAHEHILRPLREACPDAQIDLIEGNHEFRLMRHMADATPALRAVLSDLHGMTVSQILGLEQFEVNYVAKAELATFTKREEKGELEKNYRVYYDAFLTNHFPHARNWGLPGVSGHHHLHIVWSMFGVVSGPYEWHQLGCGHRRAASYCEGEKWSLGFHLAHIDAHTKAVNHEYVNVSDHAVVGGRWYHRNDGEYVVSA